MRNWLFIAVLFLLCGCATNVREDSAEALMDADPSRLIVVTLRNPGAAPVARAGSSPRDYGAPLFYGLADATRAAVTQIATDYRLQAAAQWPITQLGVQCIVFRLSGQQTQSELLQRLRTDPRVESVQPFNSFHTNATAYNDPYASLQRSLPAMGVAEAHIRSRGRGVTIAVIDTAVDTTHTDLVGRDVTERDYTGVRASGAAHGTAVAGIIAATSNNQQGIVGIAPEAKVISLAACWPVRVDAVPATCNSFTLAKALAAAIESKADVVNLSLGGPSDPLLSRLVEYGLKRGMTFVGALPHREPIGFPCDISGVLAVDSIGRPRLKADVLFAPGTDVLTLQPHDRYDFLSGSSLAAANVTGSIALLLARHPDWSAHQLREALVGSSAEGNGINVCAALLDAETSCRGGASPADVAHELE